MITKLLRDHLPLTAAVLSMVRDMVRDVVAGDAKRVAQRRGDKTKRGARRSRKSGQGNVVRSRKR
jgi:hypothetical protein